LYGTPTVYETTTIDGLLERAAKQVNLKKYFSAEKMHAIYE